MLMVLLGMCGSSDRPVMGVLTDGTDYHVLQVRGKMELYEWTNLTPTEAYHLQAEFLNDHRSYLSDRHSRDLRPPPELEASMESAKKMKTLRPRSMLQEQLESVLPFLPPEERYDTAIELISAHMFAAPASTAPFGMYV
jgi:hypothetical protein